ncbi:MAG TPA: hypothetical protein VGH14_09650, partial [Solirubrobacterales bacterium]
MIARATAVSGRHLRVSTLALALGVLLTLVLASPAAAASFEQVAEFDTEPLPQSETNPLTHPNGVAVNVGGVGGVAPGTFYVAKGPETVQVDSGQFEAYDGVRVFDSKGNFIEEWGAFQGEEPYGIAVDQVTGDVYVLKQANEGRPAVEVFSPDGSTVIARFATQGRSAEPLSEGPEKVHTAGRSGIAVDDSGDVYLSDKSEVAGRPTRVMVFKPQAPGNYEHYVYTGRANDIAFSENTSPVYFDPISLSLDDAGNLYIGSESVAEHIYKFAPSQPDVPACSFHVPGGGLEASTVNPATGEVYYWTYKHSQEVSVLNACGSDGAFTLKEKFRFAEKLHSPEEVLGLGFNPVAKYSVGRAPGSLYALVGAPLRANEGRGLIFAAAEEIPPTVDSESVGAVTPTSATLEAQISPNGSRTGFVFQYISDAAYRANDPEERQSVTVKASGGLFGLSFEGARTGGIAVGTFSVGSKTVNELKSASATATLRAAKGAGNLSGARGIGTTIAGSETITSVSAGEGEFEVGQGISGSGIPGGATIIAVASEAAFGTSELTISAPATKSAAHAAIAAGTSTVTSLTTSEGSFEAGQVVIGPGILPETTILVAGATELTLSKPAASPGAGVQLTAGSHTLTAVVAGFGKFEVGSSISGEGIPSDSKVTAVAPGEVTISAPVTKAGTGIAISSPDPTPPFAVGEAIEGPGIAPGTTIASIGGEQLTLSAPATSGGSDVVLTAGLSARATAGTVRQALESLPTIGKGGVEVSGGPGDISGSSPYEVTFTGKNDNTDVPEVSASNLSLSGGAATVVVATVHLGGGGFENGALEAPPGAGILAGNTGSQSAAVTITGLSPDTVYRYRAVASSHCAQDETKVCTGIGATESFRTHLIGTAGLPDGRAWEMVSPAQKSGGEVFPADPITGSCELTSVAKCTEAPGKPGASEGQYPMQSSSDGNSVVYQGFSFSSSGSGARFGEFISRRTSSGWQTTDLNPPLLSLNGAFQAFDASLTRGVLWQQSSASLDPRAPSGYQNLYGSETASPLAFSPLVTTTPPDRSGASFHSQFVGASADFSRSFFQANDALTEETSFAPGAVDPGEAKNNLYEAVDGQLRLVNVLPGNATSAPGASFGAGLEGLSGGGFAFRSAHSISADGRRAFWSDEAGRLYVREDGERTREVPDHTGRFLTAAANGSRVLLDDGELFDLEDEMSGVDLTGGRGGFEGIAGQSEDLSHIYFVDSAALTGGEENEYGATAQEGGNNLYAWSSGQTHYIATLSASDNTGTRGAWKPIPRLRLAEASPNGRWLAFSSRAQLTGYENVSQGCAGGSSANPCNEVFLYNADNGRLVCASCNPTGRPPIGGSTLRVFLSPPEATPQPRYVLDSGRLYFDSLDSLSQFDTNEGISDVYQWEPGGVGKCPQGGGCLNLISAGTGTADSDLLAVDETGANVFFTTRDRLVPKDADELIDVYDAR